LKMNGNEAIFTLLVNKRSAQKDANLVIKLVDSKSFPTCSRQTTAKLELVPSKVSIISHSESRYDHEGKHREKGCILVVRDSTEFLLFLSKMP